jgi:hypothetical protein
VADTPTSRSYVLASLRALHLGVRFVADNLAKGQYFQDASHACPSGGPFQADIRCVPFGVGRFASSEWGRQKAPQPTAAGYPDRDLAAIVDDAIQLARAVQPLPATRVHTNLMG